MVLSAVALRADPTAPARAVPGRPPAAHRVDRQAIEAPRPGTADGRAGAQRWLWHSRFGTILIEVAGGEIFVDGRRVEPHRD